MLESERKRHWFLIIPVCKSQPNHITMKRLILLLPMMMITLFACDQSTEIVSPGQENESVIASQAVTGNTAHAEIPNRFIVTLKPGINPGRVADDFSISADYVYRTVLNGFAGEISEAARNGLMRDHRVVRVEQDGVVTTMSAVQENATWGLDRIDQRELPLDGTYVYTSEGSGVSVYIIDTGIRYSHNEFQGRAVFGFDAFNDNRNGEDCNGHGTHVAGTVGGTEYGVAKDVDLIAVRVLDCNGSGTFSGVIAGMDWVAENASGPSVANMSIGGGSSDSIDEAVERMFEAGVSVIAAAGNGNRGGRGQDACNYSPAGSSKAYTVGATTSSDSRTSWSNYGDCVDMFAPGASITSAWHTSDTATNTISGTSMAAPHVAGVAALFLQNNTNAGSQDVYDVITQTSTKNIVTNSRTAENHLVYSLPDDSSGGDDGDNGDDNGETGDNAPSVDLFDVNTRTSGPWFRVSVNWKVTDEDGDLDTVVIEMLDGNSVVDSATISVSGSSASGETELRTRGSAGSVRLSVTDENGNSVSETAHI
jgi:subtilisin family serine protease